MGTLYYFAKHDGSRELFALNKVYHYERRDEDPTYAAASYPLAATFSDTPVRLRDVVATPEEFAERFITPEFREWGVRIGKRLFAWAGDAPIQLISEHSLDSFHCDDLTYEEHEALITGSAHDGDYEPDGMTYIPGKGF